MLHRRFSFVATNLIIYLLVSTLSALAVSGPQLQRQIAPKPTHEVLPYYQETDVIVVKLSEMPDRPQVDGPLALSGSDRVNPLNDVLASERCVESIDRKSTLSRERLDRIRAEAEAYSGMSMPDMSLYYKVIIKAGSTPDEKLRLLNRINALDVVEIAYFQPIPALPLAPTPNWQSSENYLEAAPTGINAYYGWTVAGGKGEGVRVVDIEGNWVESHEDLHGGTDHFHIAGAKILSSTWYHHGTAVLGEIAADSNSFGTTGIAFNVDLGTVSIGSMELDDALEIAVDSTEPGDIILIELHYAGPNDGAYVPAEYFQAYFDAILTASAAGRIVVEAGGNGSQDLDDSYWYGSLFDPNYRFSGALMIGAGDANHVPEWFTNHGSRIDVHGFGSDVYTLGYGDLYGTDTTNYYTAYFGGTSSASPIIVGACAILQGINLNVHGYPLDHTGMRALLQNYSTPQSPHSWLIGPMPNLSGSIEEIRGVSFYADTTLGWAPFDVQFHGSSGLSVDTWTWSLGDGDSAYVQSPLHTYLDPGIYDVSLEIDAGGDIRFASRPEFIIALADTLIGESAEAEAGDTVEIIVSTTNIVPLDIIVVPIEITGPFSPTLISYSIEGCRTEDFTDVGFSHWDAQNNRYTIRLNSSSNGSVAAMPAGSGAVLKLAFTIPGTAEADDTVVVSHSGYGSYDPQFSGDLATYIPVALNSEIVISCLFNGNADGEGSINIADVTKLVVYLFGGGAPPDPLLLGDANCDDGVNIADLTFLVAYLFGGGEPPPCGCGVAK